MNLERILTDAIAAATTTTTTTTTDESALLDGLIERYQRSTTTTTTTTTTVAFDFAWTADDEDMADKIDRALDKLEYAIAAAMPKPERKCQWCHLPESLWTPDCRA